MQPTRLQRKRTRTESRIVKAAERLMRERGVEAVTVQDITESADVGHGTFYLHFPTKSDVLRPIIDRLARRLHDQVDRVTQGEDDPAVRIAAGVRIALRAMARDPLWKCFVFHSGEPFLRLTEGLGSPPAVDARRGITTGRFRVGDLQTTVSFIDGALLGVLSAQSHGELEADAVEETAELVLRTLGLAPEEAARLARAPLDLVAPPDGGEAGR